MIHVIDLAEVDTRLQKVSYQEYAGPCPNPDCNRKRDGFRVRLNKNHYAGEDEPRGGFMCRGCWDPQSPPLRSQQRRWGNAEDYLRHMRKMNDAQVEDFLLEHGELSSSQRRRTQERPLDYRSSEWQELVKNEMARYMTQFWAPEDTRALDYVRSRGLRDRTCIFAQFGYSLANNIPRLLIPVSYQGSYTAIYRRDLRPEVPAQERWRDVAGGTKSALYLGDMLVRYCPTVVTEAAIDALSVWQDCCDIVNVVATGGTSCGKLTKWLEELIMMPLILLAFDADTSGDQEAQWWLDRLPNARRLRPTAHDLNDMLVQSGSLRPWLLEALTQPAPAPGAPATLLHIPPPGSCVSSTDTSEVLTQPASIKIDSETILTPRDKYDTITPHKGETDAAAHLSAKLDPSRTVPEAASQPVVRNLPVSPAPAPEPLRPSVHVQEESVEPVASATTGETVEASADATAETPALLTWPSAEIVAQNVAAFETKGLALQQLEDSIATSRRVAAILFRGPYTLTVYPHDYPFELMKRDADRERAQIAQDEMQRAKLARRKELN